MVQIPATSIYRSADAAAIREMLGRGQPVAVIGLSNFGKSTLLRYLADPLHSEPYRQQTGRRAIFVYVDCNRMLEMTPQGFYEVILRALLETLRSVGAPDALYRTIAAFYGRVVEGTGSFAIPLAFNNAIVALMDDEHNRDVVLLLDEFDAVLTGLDERVFLNLRAIKDKYGPRLNYVTATVRPLSAAGGGDDLAEFIELFAAHKYVLQPLSPDDATALAGEIFRSANDMLEPLERRFILEQAGGHPGLIKAVAHVVMQIESGAPASYTERAFSMAADELQNHRLVRAELNKLWSQLPAPVRNIAVTAAVHGMSALQGDQRRELEALGLIVRDEHGERLFARLLEHYARRQALVQQSAPEGVRVDLDAGTVWVEGKVTEPLTDLEYRLLLLLYGRMDKICDKYQIVESVWGQEYLGEVDDARIEKLVSRLRAKLEPDPARPKYIATVRGRGYRLNSAPNTTAP